MWFRLAALWGCTVREAQERCDSREFTEWMAYYLVEPWGHESDWLRTGRTCEVVASVFGGKGGKKLEPSDFVPQFGPHQFPTQKQLKSRVAEFGQFLRGLPNGHRHQ